MVVQKFTSADAMVKYLKGLTPSDHFKIAKSVGIQPKDKADAHLYADYIVQGTSKGLSGASLVQYAEANVARLQGIMPHLKEKHQVASVAKPTAKKTKATKKPSVAKVTKVRSLAVVAESVALAVTRVPVALCVTEDTVLPVSTPPR